MMNTMANKADDNLGKVKPGEGSRPSDAPEPRPTHSDKEKMKAVTWLGTKSVTIEDVPKPLVSHPKDVLVRVTSFTICSGSDGHIFAGEVPGMDKHAIIGHEAMGIVEDIGNQVKKINVGDRVVIAFDIACGTCEHCQKQQYTACTTTNDSKLAEKMYGHGPAALFGYSRMLGGVDGSQAEYVRVPFGDVNCFPVPNEVPDEKALFVSDVLCTSLHACDIGNVTEGSTVVIFGLGPIGLCTARWCQILGAKRVVGIDLVSDRLKVASQKLNIEVVDRSDRSSSDLIDILKQMEPNGFDTAIEAVGFRVPMSTGHKIARAFGLETDTPEIINECLTVLKPYGTLSIIGDYAGVANGFPIGKIMFKHATVVSGQCPCQKYFEYVMDQLRNGTFDPSFMVTHTISFDEVPTAYSKLQNKEEGYIKIIAHPFTHQKKQKEEEKFSEKQQQEQPVQKQIIVEKVPVPVPVKYEEKVPVKYEQHEQQEQEQREREQHEEREQQQREREQQQQREQQQEQQMREKQEQQEREVPRYTPAKPKETYVYKKEVSKSG